MALSGHQFHAAMLPTLPRSHSNVHSVYFYAAKLLRTMFEYARVANSRF